MWGRRHFSFGDNIAVGVRNLEQAASWYKEKLGLQRNRMVSEEFDAFLSFGKDDETGIALILIAEAESKANVEAHPILFTKNISVAHAEFEAKGIVTGPVQSDSGGNQFFAFQDLDGNSIEVCIEPS